jgi:hypothetical protein
MCTSRKNVERTRQKSMLQHVSERHQIELIMIQYETTSVNKRSTRRTFIVLARVDRVFAIEHDMCRQLSDSLHLFLRFIEMKFSLQVQ